MGAKNFGDLPRSNHWAATQAAMSRDENLMFLSDPRRFGDLVRTEDPEKRIAGLCENVNGQSYGNGIFATGRPDLQRRAAEVFATLGPGFLRSRTTSPTTSDGPQTAPPAAGKAQPAKDDNRGGTAGTSR